MLDTAEEMQVPLYTDPVVDVAKSGKNGDRAGLEEIVRLIQHPHINYFFVHDVDRIARWNPFLTAGTSNGLTIIPGAATFGCTLTTGRHRPHSESLDGQTKSNSAAKVAL